MALATLTIDINARLASIEKDMGRAAQIAQREAERMEQAFAAAGAAFTAIFAGASVSALTSGFVGLVNQLDALNDSADATGSSIEKISGLEDIAMRTGASLEDVTSIMVKFNGVLKEADGKNGVSQALSSIGLSAVELRKMDPADALLETSKALAQFEDDGNKARLVQELFGKSVKEAAPFLKDLADAGQINAKYTKEQAEQAEKFNKQLASMETNVNKVAREITAKLLPAFNSYLDKLNSVANFSKLNGAADGAKAYQAAIKSVVDEMELLTEEAKKDPSSVYFKEKLAALRKEYMLLQKEAAKATDTLKGTVGVGMSEAGYVVENETDKPKKKVPDMVGDKPQKASPLARASEIEREIEALERKLQTAKRLTEVERVLDDLEKGRFKDGKVSDIGKAFDLAAQIDQAKELDEVWTQLFDSLDATQKQAAANAAEAQKYFEASLTPSEKLEATLNRINELYDTGAFGTLGSAEAMDKYSRAVAAAKNETDQLNEAAKEMAEIFTRAAERGDDLASALETIIKKKLIFEPMAKSLEAGFSDLFALAGSVFGGGSAGASTSQYSLAGGSGLKLPGHKDGLDFVPYDNYVARLHKGERVLTAGENARYGHGAGVTVINYNTIGSGVSRAEVYAAMEQARQNTLATLAEQQRNRGVI